MPAAQRKTFIYHPPRKQGRLSPAMLSRREKKRAEGLFLRREHAAKIYVGTRLLTALAVSLDAVLRLATTNDADLCSFANCFLA